MDLTTIRKNKGITREFIASKVEVSVMQMYRIENGQAPFCIEKARLLANLYDVELQEVYTHWEKTRVAFINGRIKVLSELMNKQIEELGVDSYTVYNTSQELQRYANRIQRRKLAEYKILNQKENNSNE